MDAKDVTITGFYLLRVNNAFKFGDDPVCDDPPTVRDEGCAAHTNYAIAFFGDFWQVNLWWQYYTPGVDDNYKNIEYNFVHELGHRFDNQSAIGLTLSDIRLKLSNEIDTTINDANMFVVMGYLDDTPEEKNPDNPEDMDWLRGLRGWGDTASQNGTSTFQQNARYDTYTLTNRIDQTLDISEGTADMFLNWVYRRITDKVSNRDNKFDTSPVESTWEALHNLTPQSWFGFRNINGSGQYDSSLPGNARYWWMDDKMCNIFERMLRRLNYISSDETLECKEDIR